MAILCDSFDCLYSSIAAKTQPQDYNTVRSTAVSIHNQRKNWSVRHWRSSCKTAHSWFRRKACQTLLKSVPVCKKNDVYRAKWLTGWWEWLEDRHTQRDADRMHRHLGYCKKQRSLHLRSRFARLPYSPMKGLTYANIRLWSVSFTRTKTVELQHSQTLDWSAGSASVTISRSQSFGSTILQVTCRHEAEDEEIGSRHAFLGRLLVPEAVSCRAYTRRGSSLIPRRASKSGKRAAVKIACFWTIGSLWRSNAASSAKTASENFTCSLPPLSCELLSLLCFSKTAFKLLSHLTASSEPLSAYNGASLCSWCGQHSLTSKQPFPYQCMRIIKRLVTLRLWQQALAACFNIKAVKPSKCQEYYCKVSISYTSCKQSGIFFSKKLGSSLSPCHGRSYLWTAAARKQQHHGGLRCLDLLCMESHLAKCTFVGLAVSRCSQPTAAFLAMAAAQLWRQLQAGTTLHRGLAEFMEELVISECAYALQVWTLKNVAARSDATHTMD